LSDIFLILNMISLTCFNTPILLSDWFSLTYPKLSICYTGIHLYTRLHNPDPSRIRNPDQGL
jgi:hypothetical protein